MEVDPETPWIKRAKADGNRAAQSLLKGDPHEATSLLLAFEAELATTAQTAGKVTADLLVALYMTWNSLVLAYKKYGEYISCLKRLLKIHRVEALIGISELENATTKMNLGTCCHFLERPEDSLVHTNAAKTILESEIATIKDFNSTDAAYKKKLYLNLVLAFFNRGVQHYAAGDEANFKVNINQSLELATQKFGKDQAITQMIAANIGGKDASELKPFFVAKQVDPQELLMRAKGKVFTPNDIGLENIESLSKRDIGKANGETKDKTRGRSVDGSFEQELFPKLKQRVPSRDGPRGDRKRNSNGSFTEDPLTTPKGPSTNNRFRPGRLEAIGKPTFEDGKMVTFDLPKDAISSGEESSSPKKEVPVQVVQASHTTKYIQLAPIKNIIPKPPEMKSQAVETDPPPLEPKHIPYGVWVPEESLDNIKLNRVKYALRNMK
jgi:hypothetical protein